MSEKKKKPVERKIVNVNEGKTAEEVKEKQEQKSGSAGGLRIFAVVLWIAAVIFEVAAILLLNGFFYLPGDKMVWLIGAIVIDLVLVVIGSQLWKKANHLDPASKKNKVKFFLWNNMGVIASVIAFFPLIIVLLKNKDLDAKTKKIVTAIATVALLISGVFSYDWNPASEEDLAAAKTEALAVSGEDIAYWTQFGKSYHFDPDCQTLTRSSTIYQGTIEQAFEANRTDPCNFCAGGE